MADFIKMREWWSAIAALFEKQGINGGGKPNQGSDSKFV